MAKNQTMRSHFGSTQRRTFILTRNKIPEFDGSMGPQESEWNKLIEFRFQSAIRHKLNEGVNNNKKSRRHSEFHGVPVGDNGQILNHLFDFNNRHDPHCPEYKSCCHHRHC